MKQRFRDYDVYLFDFDGLLVSTQFLLYLSWKKAYQEQVPSERFLTFAEWSIEAHSPCHSKPRLAKPVRDAEQFDSRRHEVYKDMLSSPHLRLLDGVKSFLLSLDPQTVFVVTSSSRPEVEFIRRKLSSAVLEAIPYSHWFTREMYERRKPHPDGYNRAIDMACREQNKTAQQLKVVGFEDTPSGIQSLLASQPTGKKTCVLVSPFPYKDVFHASDATVVKIQHF